MNSKLDENKNKCDDNDNSIKKIIESAEKANLDYLDLNHNDYELTPDSYNVLRKSYKKFIKR